MRDVKQDYYRNLLNSLCTSGKHILHTNEINKNASNSECHQKHSPWKEQITHNLTYEVLCIFMSSRATAPHIFHTVNFKGLTINLQPLPRSKVDAQKANLLFFLSFYTDILNYRKL